MGVALASVGTVWRTVVTREKEEQLLFVGAEFAAAIARYHDRSPEGAPVFPPTLEALLEDRRFPTPQRHLRRIYVDPMTGNDRWGLVTQPDGRISGVHSLSTGVPMRTADLPLGVRVTGDGTRYSDWKFVYQPVAAPPGTPAGAGADAGASPAPVSGAPVSPSNPTPTPAPDLPAVDPVREADPRNQPNRCTDERRESMLVCLTLEGAERRACESTSTRAYATCLRTIARGG